MAGHSKWANIKFKKMGQDAKRGKLFTKCIREISIAARQGGGMDPQLNPRLRRAVDKALSVNMTRDVIDRAIKRGFGGQDGQDIEEVRYEGYGPGGVALIIDCMTNNRKRTVSDVRHLLVKYGGNLGTDGSVAYLFSEKGQILFSAGVDEEKVTELALETGAEDLQVEEDGSIEVLTPFESFYQVKQAMEAQGLGIDSAEITLIPTVSVPIEDAAIAEKFMKLTNALEELDDVQTVHSNAQIDSTLAMDFD